MAPLIYRLALLGVVLVLVVIRVLPVWVGPSALRHQWRHEEHGRLPAVCRDEQRSHPGDTGLAAIGAENLVSSTFEWCSSRARPTRAHPS